MMEKHDLEYDLDEALKRTNISLNDIKILRTKLKLVDGIPTDLTDKQLLLFINACDGVDDAAKVAKIYYDARRNAPEHFRNRDPLNDKIKQCFENQIYFVIPPTKKEDCLLIYHKIVNPQASAYYFDNALKTYIMTQDMALSKYGPRPGVIFIHDMELVGFRHMLQASISSIRKYLHYLQYGVPAKMCRIHVFNVSPLFSKILSLVRPLLKKGMIEIIHTHTSNMNYEEFFNEWIPKTHIPAEYGGDLKGIDELNDEFYNEMIAAREHFIAEEKQRENVDDLITRKK